MHMNYSTSKLSAKCSELGDVYTARSSCFSKLLYLVSILLFSIRPCSLAQGAGQGEKKSTSATAAMKYRHSLSLSSLCESACICMDTRKEHHHYALSSSRSILVSLSRHVTPGENRHLRFHPAQMLPLSSSPFRRPQNVAFWTGRLKLPSHQETWRTREDGRGTSQ